MKIITIAFFLLISIVPSQGDTEKIIWDASHRLTWNDFQGIPEKGADYVASTNSGISFSFSYTEKNGVIELDYSIKSNFYPKLSWFKVGEVSEYILKHEQAHFDISEIFARKLRKKMTETNFSKDIKSQVDKIYKENERERRDMQDRFDKETDHSKIPDAEYKWEDYIAKQLLSYDRWK